MARLRPFRPTPAAAKGGGRGRAPIERGADGPVLKHGPNTAYAEKGRQRPCKGWAMVCQVTMGESNELVGRHAGCPENEDGVAWCSKQIVCPPQCNCVPAPDPPVFDYSCQTTRISRVSAFAAFATWRNQRRQVNERESRHAEHALRALSFHFFSLSVATAIRAADITHLEITLCEETIDT